MRPAPCVRCSSDKSPIRWALRTQGQAIRALAPGCSARVQTARPSPLVTVAPPSKRSPTLKPTVRSQLLLANGPCASQRPPGELANDLRRRRKLYQVQV